MSFGIVPTDYSMLLWAPLLGVFAGLVAWLAVLVILQRRRPRAVDPALRALGRPGWQPVGMGVGLCLVIAGGLAVAALS
jgi:hypothetical protein